MQFRERLQLAYELAFLPSRLNGMWRNWTEESAVADEDELKALDDAARLHLPLPEGREALGRAIYRIALYQAGAAPYGMRTFINNVRARLNRAPITETQIPGELVADVALPGYHVPTC